ncbi:helix-turn-helix domain-containing protein [Paraburkholderia sp. UCT70]|uniref:helix-turn-helix domain-containing protein n=1 Tax=Paraburkholderia sp. UCT70 TaxID=2991068 RepID=UPI003D1D5BA4
MPAFCATWTRRTICARSSRQHQPRRDWLPAAGRNRESCRTRKGTLIRHEAPGSDAFRSQSLVVLEALWTERHVGRAAGRLHLSQSATSHALSRLRTAFADPGRDTLVNQKEPRLPYQGDVA